MLVLEAGARSEAGDMGEVPESGPEPILHEEADQVMVTVPLSTAGHTHMMCAPVVTAILATGVCGTGRHCRGRAAPPHEDQDTLSTALVTSLKLDQGEIFCQNMQ